MGFARTVSPLAMNIFCPQGANLDYMYLGIFNSIRTAPTKIAGVGKKKVLNN